MFKHSMVSDSFEQRKDRLQAIWHDYKDSDFDFSGLEERYTDKEILTLHFFQILANSYANKKVTELLTGSDKPIGAPSRLAHCGYIWELTILLASKYGFVYDWNDPVFKQMYSELFSWVFAEEDDFLRDFINREELYADLVKWDDRLIEENIKHYFDSADSEEEKQMYSKLLEHVKKYTFTGDDKMGTVGRSAGSPCDCYYPPNARKPKYTIKILPNYSEEIESAYSEYRKNLNLNFIDAVDGLLKYIFKANISEPDMGGFDYLSLDEDQGAIKVSKAIVQATDEQVYTELAKILTFCELPVPDFNALPNLMNRVKFLQVCPKSY